jgi:hypothetical protein
MSWKNILKLDPAIYYEQLNPAPPAMWGDNKDENCDWCGKDHSPNKPPFKTDNGNFCDKECADRYQAGLDMPSYEEMSEYD